MLSTSYLFITLAVTASLSTDGSSPPREQAIGRELQSDCKCDHFPDLCKCGANERAHHFYDANGHVLGTVCSAKCSSSECHPTPFSVLGVQCLSEQCFIICNDHSQCQSDDGTPAKCGPYDPKIKARVCYFPTPKAPSVFRGNYFFLSFGQPNCCVNDDSGTE